MTALRRTSRTATRSVPKYPYGLCIRLDEEVLKKLGLEGDLPCLGEMVHLCGMATVTNVSQNETESESGEKIKRCSVELQITHLATESEDAENEMSEQRRKRWYSSEEEAEEAAEAA